jgi:hypothetical protein
VADAAGDAVTVPGTTGTPVFVSGGGAAVVPVATVPTVAGALTALASRFGSEIAFAGRPALSATGGPAVTTGARCR